MSFDPERHHRRSIRLRGYDYAQPGAYFMTICVRQRQCLFGEIVGGEMQVSAAGSMVAEWWKELANKFPTIQPDVSVVMPNHFHGIIIVGAALRGCPGSGGASFQTEHRGAREEEGHPHRGAPTVGDVMDWFKTMTTNAYIRGVKEQSWLPFPGKLWQRNYFEHVVRDEEELTRVRKYVLHNPAKWAMDPENPSAQRSKSREPWEV